MKPNWEDEYEIPAEIDLKDGKWMKNPFLQELRDLNLVSLDADVKAKFPDSPAVNEALRSLIKAARTVVPDELKKAS